ncbi:conserved hypothetical protein [Gluconacetobacter diazotrophicus PA1 5]|uniref:Uncharacterized protein n=1 Tax=Gluconacetobacter diazotrophicus (strain ATCC 49037 / DSM 5601 / CCUG 37298 / CIP 103539 / LMG 7603 / PAl5) TaxID=272568 RepID=A9H2D3_GLUDA|nr:conserved hypothetical protein [Gluconacetobacter diazotrophicus PA1 5]CAP54138.1 hypothetical protein GDI0195 [Gluconacetobacter diazotrophicus PA1 5]
MVLCPSRRLKEKIVTKFEQMIETGIATWSGIVPPSELARRLEAELAVTISAFEAMRGQLRFEDEPSSFEAALQAAKQ